MSFYKKIQEVFQTEYKERAPLYRARIAAWRKQAPIVKAEKPTNLARARTLGYKAKEGFVVVRARVERGKRKRNVRMRGRKPSKSGRFYARHKSLQLIAEERAGKKYRNFEVLNSYFVGDDGQYKFYEVILADPAKTGLNLQKGRAFRGLTSQGQKMRGLR